MQAFARQAEEKLPAANGDPKTNGSIEAKPDEPEEDAEMTPVDVTPAQVDEKEAAQVNAVWSPILEESIAVASALLQSSVSKYIRYAD
jgi:hypothetical protein